MPSEEVMLWSTAYHYVAVVPVEKNPETIAGPTTLNAQIISLDGALTLVQDTLDLTLTRLPDGTDLDYLLYVSDLTIPVFLINVAVDRSQFTEVLPFQTVDNGFIVIAPEEVVP